MLGGWVNPHREQETIPQGQTSIPPKSFSTPTANGRSAPRSGIARGVGRGAGSHTPSTASESFSHIYGSRSPSICPITPLLKVPCAPKEFSGSLSYSTCTNDFGAARLGLIMNDGFSFDSVNRVFRALPGFMVKSLVIAVRSSAERNNKTRSCT